MARTRLTNIGAAPRVLPAPLHGAVAKDVALHTFAAGDNIDVVYDSNTITNTPVLSAWIEIEQ